ncbi:MAG: electron transfer flavoprotein subunit alpha/FixB family protein [Candidatus Hodarchaeota archaeon]
MVDEKVWVFSEDKNVTLELLAKGREIADGLKCKLAVVVLGSDVKKEANDYIAFGADTVYVKDDPVLAQFYVEPYKSVISGLANEKNPAVILVGGTRRGKELAPRVAQKLETGCITDCIDLRLEDSKLVVERLMYGGNAVATGTFKKEPQVAIVPPRRFERLKKDDSRKGEIVEIDVKIENPKAKIVETKEREISGVKIEDANIVVSAGRGFKKKEDLELVRELAKLLEGEVGSSRPLAADLKWLSEDHWVGLSGHKVKPDLYIAIGISGQIQHLAGMRDSKIIVAINSDEEAPILSVADYGLVANLYQAVPKLIEAIKKELGK